MAKEGGRILIADRTEPLETISAICKLGGMADYVLCDISNEAHVVAFARRAGEVFDGKIDILINNAGTNSKAHLIKDMKLADWRRTLDINLTGTMRVTQEIMPFMIARRSGKIVLTVSNVARRGLAYRADYVASKWGLLGFTRTLALELAQYGIRVNAVCPGPITGEAIEEVMRLHAEAEGRTVAEIRREWTEAAPMKRFIDPEEIAQVMMFLASDASSAMTGQGLNVTCGFLMT
jgi:NAD(P)-dependent dehydrogenase (short-subunit alcohol dehydrogenase family)